MPLAEQRGGAELMLLHLLRGTSDDTGIDYHVVFLEDGPMVADCQKLGYPTRVIRGSRLRNPFGYARTVNALRSWIKANEVDLVFSWMPKAHLYAGPAARMAGKPAVWFQHKITGGNAIDRIASRITAAAIFCCSQAAASAQTERFDSEETYVIYPAVDFSVFDAGSLPTQEQARQKLGFKPDTTVIGMVARLQRWKGVHVFLKAAAHVAKWRPDAHFVVVGGEHFSEPEYPDELQSLAEELNIEKAVHMPGHQENVPDWVASMDVLVHASIAPEPFGMVLLEGMALGKPVVATGAGGPLEIVSEGSGYLVPPGDDEAMAKQILDILAYTSETDALKDAATARAREFDVGHLARRTASVIREVVA